MSTTTNNYTSQSITDTAEAVDIFYSSHGVKQITCECDSTFNYLVIVSDAQVVIDVSHLTWSQAVIRAIVMSSWAPTSLKFTSTLAASQSLSNIHIVSFCTPHSDITVDGNVIIDPGISWSTWNLLEQNVLLWGKLKLRTLPVLDVRSNDISASHGAKVDRIDPMQMFYCMSRWLDRRQSTQLIIESMIRSMTTHIESPLYPQGAPRSGIRSCSDSILPPLVTMITNNVLSCIGISWPQIQAPSNRSHRVSHHLPSTQQKP